MKIETLLHEEIVDEFGNLSKIEVGTDEYRTAVDGVTKLLDRAIELEKLDIETKREAENQEFEQQIKLEQMREDKKDRKVKNVLTGVSIGAPLAVTIWGTLKSIKFEETGTITTIMGRGFIQKMLPKK